MLFRSVTLGSSEYDPVSIIVMLEMTDFKYTIFEESMAWTFDAFVGNLGGVLGLWLGIDMIVMTEILLFVVSLSFGFCRRRKTRANEVQYRPL